MLNDPDQHDRRSIRPPGWDYRTPAAYFVTICVHDHVCLFGDVVQGRMFLNDCGRIVAEEWQRTERVRANVVLDAFVVMPNHVHGVIGIMAGPDQTERGNRASTDDDARHRRRGTAGPKVMPVVRRAPTGANRQFGQPRSGSLSTIVGAFKSSVTRRINRHRGTPGEPVWQRGFYERVVRNRRELERIRAYIRRNPAQWRRDRQYPGR